MWSTFTLFLLRFMFSWFTCINAYENYQQGYSPPYPYPSSSNQQPYPYPSSSNQQPYPYPSSSNQQPYQPNGYQQSYYPNINYGSPYIEDQVHWRAKGQAEVMSSFQRPVNYNHFAKNIIIMVAEGMDANTVTASRIYSTSEGGLLTFERFPHLGLLKTYSANKKVPDAAATGTALFTGVKTNNEVIGVDARVRHEDYMASTSSYSKVTSILQWAQEVGKNTGFVTNKRITDAIPSSLYAHSASRYWECDSAIPEHMRSHCKDIARQLIEDEPGNNLNVIFGGGRQCMITNPNHVPNDHVDLFTCQRTDGKNLIEEWERNKRSRGAKFVTIKDSYELMDKVDTSRAEYVLGLFTNSYFPYAKERNHTRTGVPTLEMMVEPAIKILKKYRHPGFVLMVHSGLIDLAHHSGDAHKAIEETLEFERAVIKVQEVVNSLGIQDETLLIVTGGHGHTMSINGYPDRNSSILGIAQKSKHDDVPYTTLSYATGSTVNNQYYAKDGYVYRNDPRDKDTTDREYHQLAAIHTDKETHGGSDVPVYAIGPMAHMFYGIHEQSYVAYVMAYATKTGPFRNAAVTNIAAKLVTFGSTMALLLYVNI